VTFPDTVPAGGFGSGISGFRNTGTVIANTVIVFGTGGALLFYNGTPALGNLFLAISPNGGTDTFGNVYLPGIDCGISNTIVHIYNKASNIGVIDFPTQINIESAISELSGATSGLSGHRFIQLACFGPGLSNALVPGHDDFVHTTWNSANEDGTSSANLDFNYHETTAAGGALNEYAYMDASGFNITAGSAVGVQPGTGTVVTPAVADPWHNLTLANGWAAAGSVGVRYRKGVENEVKFDVVVSSAAATSNQVGTMPAGYRPSGTRYFALGSNDNVAGGATAGNAGPFFQVTPAGLVQIAPLHAFSAAGTWVGNGCIPLD